MATMQRERVKPATGVPFFFEIEKLGVRANSQYAPAGYEFRYEGSLIEGNERKLALTYLAPEAHEAIEQAGAKIGDLVRLLKTKDGQYLVKVLSDAVEPAPPREIHRVNGHANGNGQTNGAAKPVESHPMEDLLTRCFETAGRAIFRAHMTLTAEGCELELPIWEDVRACGISLFIERSRNGGSR